MKVGLCAHSAGDIKTAWGNGEQEHRDGQSGERKKRRTDLGGQHHEAKRRFESHLSKRDVGAL